MIYITITSTLRVIWRKFTHFHAYFSLTKEFLRSSQRVNFYQFWLRMYGIPEAVIPAALMVNLRVKLLL